MQLGLTPKQIELLTKIRDKNPDGSLLSIEQLHDAVSYTCTRQAITCSLNFLIKRGLIEKSGQNVVRNGRRFTVVSIKPLGEEILNAYVPSLRQVLVENEDEEIEKSSKVKALRKPRQVGSALRTIAYGMFWSKTQNNSWLWKMKAIMRFTRLLKSIFSPILKPSLSMPPTIRAS